MRRIPLMILLAAASLLAQGPIGPPSPVRFLFPPELAAYLQLTQEQTGRLAQQQTENLRFSAQKQLRIAQVQQEIAEWTEAEPLDPGQLGIRYAEVEAIRRELRDAEGKMRQSMLAVLNDAQKARLKMLDDAQKLQFRINEANCVGLLAPASPQSALLGIVTVGTIQAMGPFGCAGAIGGLMFDPMQP